MTTNTGVCLDVILSKKHDIIKLTASWFGKIIIGHRVKLITTQQSITIILKVR